MPRREAGAQSTVAPQSVATDGGKGGSESLLAPDALSSASGGELTGELVSDCGLLDAWKPDVSVLQGRLEQPLVDSFSLSHSGEDQPIRTQADTYSMTSAALPPRESGKPAPQSTGCSGGGVARTRGVGESTRMVEQSDDRSSGSTGFRHTIS